MFECNAPPSFWLQSHPAGMVRQIKEVDEVGDLQRMGGGRLWYLIQGSEVGGLHNREKVRS
ncbi:hypothetical protein SESBI_21186 [Sesbania bispinosa]|nr:hypothetical protein SESBI_21186 [Sesbania bispinosa]